MAGPTLDAARVFLTSRRIAIVGVSRNEKDFSRVVMRELVSRGYDVVPVNPAAAEMDGRPCFGRLQDVAPAVDAALLLTTPAQTEVVLRDCVEARVGRVWLHRGGGPGAASPRALEFCAARGILVVHDLCPFMALDGVSLPHRVHGYLRRRFGHGAPA